MDSSTVVAPLKHDSIALWCLSATQPLLLQRCRPQHNACPGSQNMLCKSVACSIPIRCPCRHNVLSSNPLLLQRCRPQHNACPGSQNMLCKSVACSIPIRCPCRHNVLSSNPLLLQRCRPQHQCMPWATQSTTGKPCSFQSVACSIFSKTSWPTQRPQKQTPCVLQPDAHLPLCHATACAVRSTTPLDTQEQQLNYQMMLFAARPRLIRCYISTPHKNTVLHARACLSGVL
jgi:hypothetical protein